MRYAVLAASLLIQVCLGGLYAWSSFVPALRDGYGLSSAQTQVVFGLLIAVFTVAMVPAGRVLPRRGPKLLTLAGGMLFGAGYVLASFSGGTYALLLLGIGVLAGIGTGLGYVCPLATGVRWFPRHKGLVTGLSVAGFGAGAVLLSTLTEVLLARGVDVLAVFRWIGLGYGLVITACSLVMRFPPSSQGPQPAPGRSSVAIFRDPFFYGLLAGMFSGTFAGLLVIGNLKLLATTVGISPAGAALSISILAAGNATGRIVWGWLADRLGAHAVWLSLGFLALALAFLSLGAKSTVGFSAASFLVGFGFGACFSVYAAQVAAHFGVEHLGKVYPFVFLGYGVAGVAGPWVGGWLYDTTGDYDAALLVSLVAVVAGLGVAAWLLSGRPARKDQSPSETALGEPDLAA